MVEVQGVTLWLEVHCLQEDLNELLIQTTSPQWIFDAYLSVGKQAWQEHSIGSQPEPVTPLTKGMTDWAYETYLPLTPVKSKPPRRAIILSWGNRDQWPEFIHKGLFYL